MNRRGFTLVEMAVVLLLTGLIAGIVLKVTASSGTAECYTTTKTQINTIRDAVERFALRNDRFPLPARRNAGVESSDYGREAVVGNLDSVTNPDTSVAVFGAVPFQALGIPVENAADCWGNKYTYVVTKDLTDTAKFTIASTQGAINIKTTLADPTPFLAGAGYAIISHGEDQRGAVKNNYVTSTNTLADRKWCSDDLTIKTQNCALVSSKIAGVFNNGKNAGGSYFDDIIVYRGKPWRNGSGADSNVYCWGRNTNGYVGDNSTLPRPVPVTVQAPIKFTSVTTGHNHTCGVDENNNGYCWGDGYYGETGAAGVYGVNAPNKVPLSIDISTMIAASGRKFKDVQAGYLFSCGLTTTDWAYCWGKGDYGQLGNGGWSTMGAPQFVSTGPFKQIATGMVHACALNSGGQALCWGANMRGQIGNGLHDGNPSGGSMGNPATPTPVSGGLTFNSIAAGNVTSCGLRLTGELYCWGGGVQNYYTEGGTDPDCLWDAGAAICVVPKPVAAGLRFGRIAMGQSGNICGLTEDGTAYCWGGAVYTPTLVDVTALPAADRKFTSIRVGENHSCALAMSGTEYCWGSDSNAALGTNGGPDLAAPSTAVLGSGTLPKIFGVIAAGGEHSCAIAVPLVTTDIPPINGGWDAWSACTAPCNGGTAAVTRTCSLGAPAACEGGAAAETGTCINNTVCPPVMGLCGGAQWSCTQGNLANVGMLTCVSHGIATYPWDCQGLYGGATVSCHYDVTYGACP